MGAGKTTIGRFLAAELLLPFIDTDEAIEQRCGADIPWIFDVEGEAGFRDREHKVLQELCQSSDAVIATGGGIVIREDNRSIIESSGVVVYLHATIEQQLMRTGKDRKRPLLNNDDPRAVLTALMQAREPLYRQLADVVVNTDSRNPRVTANLALKQLQPLLNGAASS